MWRLAVVIACVALPMRAGSAEPGAAASNAGAVAPGAVAPSAVDPGALMSADTWRYRSGGDLAVDGGLAVGFPAALPTGLAKGAGLGVTMGRTLAWGVRASWLTATESSLPWTVTHSDLKLRATGALQASAGRATVGLRLGLGVALVHESRVRNQGMRAGLMGSELETSAFRLLPAADLDAVIALHIAGPWLLMTSGGPSVDRLDGKLHGGWSAQLGVAWQP
jgi:hypothetical protein